MVQQVAEFSMDIPTTEGHFLTVGGELKLIYEVDHSATLDEQVDIGAIAEGEYVLLLGLEVE